MMRQQKTNQQLLKRQVIKLYILFAIVIILALVSIYAIITTFTGYQHFDEEAYRQLYTENVSAAESKQYANEVYGAVPTTPSQGQAATLNLDNVGYQNWKTHRDFHYYYLPFLSYQPGLYTIEMTYTDDIFISFDNMATNDRMGFNQRPESYEMGDSNKAMYYNIYLNPATIIKVYTYHNAPYQIKLIPQDSYIQYDEDNPQLGLYPVGTAIDAGTYDVIASDPYATINLFFDPMWVDRVKPGEELKAETGDVIAIDDPDTRLSKTGDLESK